MTKKAPMKRSSLEKALALGNRLASGQPKGRSENDSPTKIAKARAEHSKKALKIPKVSKRSSPTSRVSRVTEARMKKAGL